MSLTFDLSSSSDSDSWDSIEDHDSDPALAATKCLSIGSKHFNPLLALGCTDFKLPVPDAPRYHSLPDFDKCVPNLQVEGTPPSKFPVSQKDRKVLARIPRQDVLAMSSAVSTSSAVSASSASVNTVFPSTSGTSLPISALNQSAASSQDYPIPGRRFLPHQLPVPVSRVAKKKPNVMTLMDDCDGPLQALNQARLKFNRIRVWRRDPTGIRGYCTGFVVGFDKHWNLILKDVDEIFQRRRLKPGPLPNTSIASASPTSTREAQDAASIGSTSRGNSLKEKLAFKSGALLSKSSKVDQPPNASVQKDFQVVRKGTPTGYLINGPQDAVEVCRIGIRSLLKQGLEREKSKSDNTKMTSDLSPPVTKSTLRKKQLVILRQAETDFLGNKIVARSQLYEIVERHLAQTVIMGRSIAFVETSF